MASSYPVLELPLLNISMGVQVLWFLHYTSRNRLSTKKSIFFNYYYLHYLLDICKPLVYIVSMKINIKKIKLEMKRKNMSQVDLSRKLGLTRQRIWYILNFGVKSYRVTEMLAKALNVDAKDLII